MERQRPKIKVLGGGPYRVTGGVPLKEILIVPENGGYRCAEGEKLPQQESYLLCRCGKTKRAPFCDGAHQKAGFIGTETASRESYSARARKIEGPGLDLYDDNRCAYARYCHRASGTAWSLTRESDDPFKKSEAILAAQQCPTARLTAVEKDGTVLEKKEEPCIEVAQDVEENVSCGLFIKGAVALEAADGYLYEARPRAALCRCGRSRSMPFCDAMHVPTKFRDK